MVLPCPKSGAGISSNEPKIKMSKINQIEYILNETKHCFSLSNFLCENI